MSDLPTPVSRQPLHTRRLRFDGYLRDDGLWDIDCELEDVAAVPLPLVEGNTLPAGQPMHLLRVRLTIDDQLTVRAVQTAMAEAPFPECQRAAADPMQKLVGLTMGSGWRKAIDHAMGGTAGCTHYRELVFNAATAAFQLVPRQKARLTGENQLLGRGGKPPFFMGKCLGWALDGPVVQRVAPQFHQRKS